MAAWPTDAALYRAATSRRFCPPQSERRGEGVGSQPICTRATLRLRMGHKACSGAHAPAGAPPPSAARSPAKPLPSPPVNAAARRARRRTSAAADERAPPPPLNRVIRRADAVVIPRSRNGRRVTRGPRRISLSRCRGRNRMSCPTLRKNVLCPRCCRRVRTAAQRLLRPRRRTGEPDTGSQALTTRRASTRTRARPGAYGRGRWCGSAQRGCGTAARVGYHGGCRKESGLPAGARGRKGGRRAENKNKKGEQGRSTRTRRGKTHTGQR